MFPILPRFCPFISRKVPQGCSTCRTRKLKCDEARPVCNRCQGARLPCEWLAVARRQPRKQAPGSPKNRDGPVHCRLLLPRERDAPHPIPKLAIPDLRLLSSTGLSSKDLEYLSFFPHTLLIRVLGKSWRWSSLHYLRGRVASGSPAAMRMILAISASELEMMRCAQQLKPRPTHALPRHDGVAYYRRALEEFRVILRELDYRSAKCLNEVLAIFFLMVVYEQQFGRHASGMEAHLRGLYAFLATMFATKQDLSLAGLPLLGQQLLLFTMLVTSEPNWTAFSSDKMNQVHQLEPQCSDTPGFSTKAVARSRAQGVVRLSNGSAVPQHSGCAAQHVDAGISDRGASR